MGATIKRLVRVVSLWTFCILEISFAVLLLVLSLPESILAREFGLGAEVVQSINGVMVLYLALLLIVLVFNRYEWGRRYVITFNVMHAVTVTSAIVGGALWFVLPESPRLEPLTVIMGFVSAMMSYLRTVWRIDSPLVPLLRWADYIAQATTIESSMARIQQLFTPSRVPFDTDRASHTDDTDIERLLVLAYYAGTLDDTLSDLETRGLFPS